MYETIWTYSPLHGIGSTTILSMKKVIISIVLIALVGGGTAFWYFVIRDEKLSVSTKNVDTDKSTDEIAEQSSPDGTWEIQQQDDVFAGYEIKEIFGGESIEKTAVGKSKAVTGGFVISDGMISEGLITVDTTKMSSNESRRDDKMSTSGLEADAFPEAIFDQGEPSALPNGIEKNQELQFELSGTFFLHGQSKEITFPLKAKWDGKVIVVSGELEIKLADYGIEPPDSPFVSVRDEGKIKLQLLFVPKN